MKFSTITLILSFTLLGNIRTSAENDLNDIYLNRTFNEWTWLTSHNSHLNWFDNSVIQLASNQNLSLDEQLNNGVRGFMFDVDFLKCSNLQSIFGSCSCEGVCLCHGECSKQSDKIKDGFSIKKLEYALRKLVNFLRKNKDQIITIFLEDYLNDTRLLQSVFDRVKYFNSLVFDPYSKEWNVSKNGWPLIKDMVNANKRILIFDDEQRSENAKKRPGIIRGRDYMIENHYEWFNDEYLWNISKTSSSLRKQLNATEISLEMSRCFSLHKTNQAPNWHKNKTIDLDAREYSGQLFNSDKLFLFHHYYGVSAKSIMINPLTVELMNTKEFVLERLETECYPGTNWKKPNYIALDFISKKTYNDLIVPFNIDF